MNLLQQGVLEPQSTNHVVIMGNALQPTQRLFVITMAESEKYLPFPIGSHSNLLPFFYFFPFRGLNENSPCFYKNLYPFLQGDSREFPLFLKSSLISYRVGNKSTPCFFCSFLQEVEQTIFLLAEYKVIIKIRSKCLQNRLCKAFSLN